MRLSAYITALTGVGTRDLCATLSWDSKHLLHIVKASVLNQHVEFSSDAPFSFVGASTLNMKSALSALTINGEMIIAVPSDDEITRKKIPGIDMCVTTGASTGPVLAVADGSGIIRLYNQDADLMQTCETVSTGPSSSALHLGIIKGSESYHMVSACRDGLLRVYEVPWSVAHSRYRGTLSSIPSIQEHLLLRCPVSLSEIGRLLPYRNGKIILLDFSLSSVCVLDVLSGTILQEHRNVGGGVITAQVEDDRLYLVRKNGRTSLSLT